MELSPGKKMCFLEDVPGDTLISAEWELSALSEDADMDKYVVFVVFVGLVFGFVFVFVLCCCFCC